MRLDIFTDNQLNKQIKENGYVILSLLGQEEIDKFISFHTDSNSEFREAFTTFIVDDYQHRKNVDSQIKSILSPALSGLFSRHEAFWGNIFTKTSGSPAIPLHSDFQFVDESDDISLNIWCPLMDTDSENGTLGIVPASHKAVNDIRGTNVTNHYRYHAQDIQDKFGLTLSLKAGEAVVYDHRLLHYSTANKTDKQRLAVSLICTPIGQQIIHYYAENEDSTTIYKYNMNSVDDFLKMKFLQRPEFLIPIQILHNYHYNKLTTQHFNALNKNALIH